MPGTTEFAFALLMTTFVAMERDTSPAAQKSEQWAGCRPAGSLQKIAGVSEASGLAASRTVPGRLWTHNDSGEPVLYAIDARGSVVANLRLSGATVEDWEAVAVGACDAGSCLYVGDIGDNTGSRKRISVYRVPEPAKAPDAGVVTDVIRATYPDGAHDAETLLVAADGTLFIVTKGESGPVALYKFPRRLEAGASVRLERVGAPRPGAKGKDANADRITDGAVSPDGAWVALRSKTALFFYPAADFFAGTWREARRVDLTPLGEPQGEGVAFGADGSVFLASEGGGKSQPGRLGRLTCSATR